MYNTVKKKVVLLYCEVIFRVRQKITEQSLFDAQCINIWPSHLTKMDQMVSEPSMLLRCH